VQRPNTVDQIHEDPPHVPGDLIIGRHIPDVLIKSHLAALHLNVEMHRVLDHPALAIQCHRLGLDDGVAVGLDHVAQGVLVMLVTEGGVHGGLVEVGGDDAAIL